MPFAAADASNDKRNENRLRAYGLHGPNENKMSDGGRVRASLGVKVWQSS
jgi:hypothetical protein